ncbi:hypothetical protein [Beggiatoa leptomitoformis]|uniref:Uncharacterized protein n=1 Tax=Beggiatoa leptomitoformis TaxID=288004 RepID=A0A2N9YF70_9GAMM|nr:hypothetical protein [Beggiatoa leptomitoformis]ALG68524.1 hypothetical protein AL038_13480 [Beggiatoa leptomitoformis]AUI69134.1 hypothetical protein BLE401_10780 [Beggiatoa leptomitoformis]
MLKRVLLLLCFISYGTGQTVYAEQRALLYPAMDKLSTELQSVVTEAQKIDRPSVPYEQLTQQTRYYTRIAPRKYVLDANNQLLNSAILSTKPIAFVTTPDGIYGKSLLDIYLDIGYEAEDIIHWQRDVPMVAIVFRFPDEITQSEVLNGELPAEWRKTVIIPTWDNLFTVFQRFATDATVDANKKSEGDFSPNGFFFRSDANKSFVLGYPEIGKERLKTASYQEIKATGGADWAYRELLEQKLSIFEHFRGTGRTQNEIVDPQGIHHESGLFEFIAPNFALKDLAEIAVIDLGLLSMQGTYIPVK